MSCRYFLKSCCRVYNLFHEYILNHAFFFNKILTCKKFMNLFELESAKKVIEFFHGILHFINFM